MSVSIGSCLECLRLTDLVSFLMYVDAVHYYMRHAVWKGAAMKLLCVRRGCVCVRVCDDCVFVCRGYFTLR